MKAWRLTGRWDYFERAAEFRAWLDARIASGVLVEQARACALAAPSLPVYARVDGYESSDRTG